jgi:ribosomal protein S18 acetylase RimI-like enzyme
MDILLEQIHAPVSGEDAAFLAKGLQGVWEHLPAYEAAGLFKEYLDVELARDDVWCFVAVEKATGTRVGVVTVTRFSMIRYLGCGYEIEEVSVLPEFQGKGIAPRMLELVVERFGKDPQARKVLIRTNGTNENAKKAYGRVVSMTDMVSMHKLLNLLPPEPNRRSRA